MNQNIARARAFLDRFAASTSVADDACTPDATWWTYLSGEVPLADHVKRAQLTAEAQFSGPGCFDIEETIATEDKVVFAATGHQPLRDGRLYANTYLIVLTFEGDRIRSVRACSDTALALRVLAS